MGDSSLSRFDYSYLERADVRAWASWLIAHHERALREQGRLSPTITALIADLRGGLDHPERFDLSDPTGHGAMMQAAFQTLYRDVIQGGGDEYRLDRQGFFGGLPPVRRPPDVALEVKDGVPDIVPRPEDGYALFRRYPDIARSARGIRQRIDALLGDPKLDGGDVRVYLEGLLAELGALAADGGTDPTTVRDAIDGIAARVDLVSDLVSAPRMDAAGAVVRVVEMYLRHRRSLPEGAQRDKLDAIYRNFTGDGEEREVDDGMRMGAALLFSSLDRFLDSFGGDKDILDEVGGPAPTDAAAARGELRPPTLADRIAWGEDPLSLLAGIDYSDQSPAAVGAQILLGVYRRRLGENSPLLDAVEPHLHRLPWIDQAPAGFGEGDPDTIRARRMRGVPAIEMAQRTRNPAILEFGGGATPAGINLAVNDPSAVVLSADPQTAAVWPRLLTASSGLPNFHPLSLRAEEVALFAAAGAFVDRVVAVAPTQAQLPAMLLSALLLVRPGGRILIYQDERISAPTGLLGQLGLEWQEATLEPGDVKRPPSQDLRGKPMRKVEVIGGGPFGTDPLKPTGTDGRGSFGGVVVGGGSGPGSAAPGDGDGEFAAGSLDVMGLGAETFVQTGFTVIAVPSPAAAAVGR